MGTSFVALPSPFSRLLSDWSRLLQTASCKRNRPASSRVGTWYASASGCCQFGFHSFEGQSVSDTRAEGGTDAGWAEFRVAPALFCCGSGGALRSRMPALLGRLSDGPWQTWLAAVDGPDRVPNCQRSCRSLVRALQERSVYPDSRTCRGSSGLLVELLR